METTASPRTDTAANARTLASQAQELLRADILSGRLAPGQRLRTKDLQARYGLGLSPLRESLQRLSAEGMVVNDEQRGFAVAPVSVEELKDLTLARTALESIMLPMAIAQGTADWEAEIVAAFHRLSRTSLPVDTAAVADARQWELRHRAFHHALVAGCGSPWLLRLHAQLVDQSERYRKIRILHHQEQGARVRDVNAEHHAVMDAVLRRDAAQATELMTGHLRATSQATAELMHASTPLQEKSA
ncbi:MAG: FCD domain-containing protein [Rhodoferax sp.]|nr:FCD domain-containing protein [Rhodoferax sp.]